MIGSRSTQEVIAVCSPEEVLIYQEEVWFLGYVISLEDIHIENKKIEIVKQ